MGTLRFRAPLLAALALASLGGCAAMSGNGSGPVTLSPRVKAAYDHYRSLPGPQAFAVSTDGTAYGATYCRWGTCRGNDVSIALENCRKSGKTCFIYDREGRVVWQGADQPAARVASARGSGL
jgi:hypothetical protein